MGVSTLHISPFSFASGITNIQYSEILKKCILEKILNDGVLLTCMTCFEGISTGSFQTGAILEGRAKRRYHSKGSSHCVLISLKVVLLPSMSAQLGVPSAAIYICLQIYYLMYRHSIGRTCSNLAKGCII